MNFNFRQVDIGRVVGGAICLASLLFGGSGASASTFNFAFDGAGLNSDGPAAPPYVGTGVLSFSGELDAGTYQLSSLTGLSMNFNFDDNQSFSLADNTTPLTEALIVLTGSAGSETLTFSNTNVFGTGNQGGSIDFVNSNQGFLSFEPPGFENLPPSSGGLHLYQEGTLLDDPSGNYLATESVSAVPLPASAPMFGAALLAFGAVGYGMKRKAKATA